jgi:D-alanyl-D-alanine carboxypeptidase
MMSMVRRRVFANGTVAVPAAVGALVPASTGSPSTSADAKLDRALARLVTMRGGPPGVVAIVQRGSKRIVFRHGVAERSPQRSIALGDHWRIASVAKAFSGAVIVTLVGRRRLRLDDTIGKRLPELPKAWHKVTLAQALQHTSGLPEYSSSPGAGEQIETHPLAPVQPSTLISWVADQELRFAPGSKYQYSNTDNIVAALFAEKATGLSYERALHALVLDPLRLRGTSLPAGYRMPLPYVHGYSGKNDHSEVVNPTLAWASGGIVSTPLDLTRFIRWYAPRARGPFRPGESDPAGPGANDAGLAIFRYRTPCGTVYGHTGNFFGYTAFIAATRNGRRSVTIQASTQLSKGTGDLARFRRCAGRSCSASARRCRRARGRARGGSTVDRVREWGVAVNDVGEELMRPAAPFDRDHQVVCPVPERDRG